MRLEVLPILLRVPESFHDARRYNGVLHCLLDLVLQVLRVLDVPTQDRDRAGKLLQITFSMRDGTI